MSTVNYFDSGSSETPIPLRKCPSLRTSKVFFQSEPYWVVKSPHSQEYQHLNAHQFAILEKLDGNISYRELQESFNREQVF